MLFLVSSPFYFHVWPVIESPVAWNATDCNWTLKLQQLGLAVTTTCVVRSLASCLRPHCHLEPQHLRSHMLYVMSIMGTALTISPKCNDPSRHPYFFLTKSPCRLP